MRLATRIDQTCVVLCPIVFAVYLAIELQGADNGAISPVGRFWNARTGAQRGPRMPSIAYYDYEAVG